MKKKRPLVLLCLLLAIFLAACSGNVSDILKNDSKEPAGKTVKSESEKPEKQTEAALKELESSKEPETTKEQESTKKEETTKESSLEVHFLDVGQGDSALILCDGEAMLIDGGGSRQSDLLYSYLQQQNIDKLKYIVATHPDSDHVGGLAGALNYADAETAWCSVSEYNENEAFGDFVKYLKETKVEVPQAGQEFALGAAKGIVLGPQHPESAAADSNDNSLVIRLTHGNNRFLFTGDAEEAEEFELLSSDADLSADVLKIAHHGSASSSTPAFLEAVHPTYAVISCGSQNPYGHPADQTLSRLQNLGVKLFRTDLQGHIIFKSDGENLSFSVNRNADADTYLTYAELNPTEAATEAPEQVRAQTDDSAVVRNFILNKNTGKIHEPDCKDVRKMSEHNKIPESGTYQDILARYPGFTPCGNCHPDW